VWVSKEPDNSQGDGIIVNPDFNELKETWLSDPSAGEPWECKGADEPVILQKYILDPLLLNGKKMEIRTYWVIACLDPLIVLYHDGTVRLTTRDYSETDWHDPLIHITNTKQQKEANPDYHLTEHERKWTVEQLAQYLFEKGKVDNAEKWLDSYLRPILKKYIGLVVSAAHPHLMRYKEREGWDGRFELLGMDVILDQNLRPWLTEIQMGPGLSRDRGIKEHVLPRMLEELTDIMLEIDYDFRYRQGDLELSSAHHWQVVPVFQENWDISFKY
jgi:hypothetical protein